MILPERAQAIFTLPFQGADRMVIPHNRAMPYPNANRPLAYFFVQNLCFSRHFRSILLREHREPYIFPARALRLSSEPCEPCVFPSEPCEPPQKLRVFVSLRSILLSEPRESCVFPSEPCEPPQNFVSLRLCVQFSLASTASLASFPASTASPSQKTSCLCVFVFNPPHTKYITLNVVNTL